MNENCVVQNTVIIYLFSYIAWNCDINVEYKFANSLIISAFFFYVTMTTGYIGEKGKCKFSFQER